MTPAPPKRGPQCPPTVELEAFAAGETRPFAEHVAGCGDCGPYVAALKLEADAFGKSRTPELFLKQLERRAAQPAPSRPWWRWLGVLVPVAVAAVLVVRGGLPADDGVTFKGGGLKLFLKRGEAEPQPLAADAKVQAGDALRFSFDAPSDGYLAVFDLDGREAVTVFWPYGSASAGKVNKAQGLVPGSVVLDASPGPEWVVAVFSPEPFDTAAISAQLKGQATRPSIEVSCARCQVTSQRLARP